VDRSVLGRINGVNSRWPWPTAQLDTLLRRCPLSPSGPSASIFSIVRRAVDDPTARANLLSHYLGPPSTENTHGRLIPPPLAHHLCVVPHRRSVSNLVRGLSVHSLASRPGRHFSTALDPSDQGKDTEGVAGLAAVPGVDDEPRGKASHTTERRVLISFASIAVVHCPSHRLCRCGPPSTRARTQTAAGSCSAHTMT